MNDDGELLQQFRETGSEAAFKGLVERHLGIVYSAALRRVRGDSHLAEDIAQTVFIDLARKAQFLPREVVLAGWLYRASCLRAAEKIRAEARRRGRERIALEMNTLRTSGEEGWRDMSPVLEEDMQHLSRTDRDALLLRFFQNASLEAVGKSLGISEDAAQKRVARALERLRIRFVRRGIGCSTAALVSALSAYAAPSAPPDLAATLSSAAFSGAAAHSGFSMIQTILFMSKAKIIVGGSLLVLAATVLIQHRENARLRQELRMATAASLDVKPVNLGPDQVATPKPASAAVSTGVAAADESNLSVEALMQQAIGLTRKAQLRDEIVKLVAPLIGKINAKDLKKAADLAQGLQDHTWRVALLEMVLKQWAGVDGKAAVDYLVSNIKGEAQWPLLAGVLPDWAKQDPEGAWRWFQDARSALQFGAHGAENSTIMETFGAMALNDFERTIGKASELQGSDAVNAFLGLAQGAQTREQREQLLVATGNIADATQREAAAQGVLISWARQQPEEAATYIESLTNATMRSDAARFAGPVILGTDPTHGAAWWLDQTTPADRLGALRDIAHAWAGIDVVGAADWVQTLGNGAEADIAKQAVADAAVWQTPETAAAWAASIADPQTRLEALRGVYFSWHGRNATAADSWLTAANLPVDLSSEIKKPPLRIRP